ncbi:MAG: hypothetical protein ACK56I_24805, partial [bacterium]
SDLRDLPALRRHGASVSHERVPPWVPAILSGLLVAIDVLTPAAAHAVSRDPATKPLFNISFPLP